MGKMTPAYAEEYAHEVDDLTDELAKLVDAWDRRDAESMRLLNQRISTHLTRLDEVERLVEILEDD